MTTKFISKIECTYIARDPTITLPNLANPIDVLRTDLDNQLIGNINQQNQEMDTDPEGGGRIENDLVEIDIINFTTIIYGTESNFRIILNGCRWFRYSYIYVYSVRMGRNQKYWQRWKDNKTSNWNKEKIQNIKNTQYTIT